MRQSTSSADAREKLLTLTTTGMKASAQLDQQSTTQIEKMLAHLTAADRESMVASLAVYALHPRGGAEAASSNRAHSLVE